MREQKGAGLSTNERVDVQPRALQRILGFHLALKSNDSSQVIFCLGDLCADLRFNHLHRDSMPEQMIDRIGRQLRVSGELQPYELSHQPHGLERYLHTAGPFLVVVGC